MRKSDLDIDEQSPPLYVSVALSVILLMALAYGAWCAISTICDTP